MEGRAVQRVALFIAVLAGFITPFDLSAVNIALPAIGAEFGMDAVALGWIPTAYLLSSAVFLVPFGRIADLYGRKKVCLAGLLTFAISSLLMVFSPFTLALILFRVMQGAGAALIFGTAVAILTSVTPPGERGKALGIYTTSVYLGLSLGPFIGGFLTQHLGWRSIFLVNIPTGAAAIALLLWKLEGEWADGRGGDFDLKGAVVYGIMLVTLIYGLSSLPSPPGIALILVSLVFLLLFLWHEWQTKCPLLDLTLLRENRPFAFSNLAAFLNYGATFAVTFFLSLYLQYVRGFSPSYAGVVLVTQPLVQAILSPAAGRLSDRVDPGKVASVGMALNAAGLLLLSALQEGTAMEYVFAVLLLMGLGFALFSSPNTNAIMSTVAPRCYGIASGMLGTMRLVGQMFSMGIAMTLVTLYVGRVEIGTLQHPLFMEGMKNGFLIFFILCAAGVYASLVRGRAAGGEKEACRVGK